MLRKPKPGEICGPTDPLFVDRSFAEQFPTLNDYLTVTKWDDGRIRTTATLLIFVDNGSLKVCINDRDNSRSAFVSEATFAALLDTLEAKLTAETLDWRMKGRNGNSPGYTPF